MIGYENNLIARFMGPTWGASGADRIQVSPMLAPWTLVSGVYKLDRTWQSVHKLCVQRMYVRSYWRIFHWFTHKYWTMELLDAISCIELNGSLRSEWFGNVCGIRQGDWLSPSLFSLYINDALKRVWINIRLQRCAHIYSLLYADELVIVPETEKQLQNLLNLVFQLFF